MHKCGWDLASQDVLHCMMLRGQQEDTDALNGRPRVIHSLFSDFKNTIAIILLK